MINYLVISSEIVPLVISFGTGYISHLLFKSTLYPTFSNTPSLIVSIASLLIVLTLLFSIFHSMLLVFGFLSSLTVCRTVLSPINAYKGPFLAKLSKLWGIYESLDGNYYRKVKSLFDQHNCDWIRVGPNELVTRDIDAIKIIYGNNGWDKGLLDPKL
jgi:hypothetical protein